MPVSAKSEAKKIITNLPDDSSFEDIQYHLFLAEKLTKARKQIKEGKIHTQEEVDKRLAKWTIK